MVSKRTIGLLSLILIIESFQTTQKKEPRQLSAKQVKLLNSGDELFQQRNYIQALEIYDKVIKQESVDPIYYDRRAICYLKTGDLENALTEFKNAVDSGRKTYILDAPLFADLGSKFCIRNNFQEALWCYSKAMEIDSSNRSYIYWRGFCNSRLKNIDEALSDFKIVIQMDPNSEDLIDELAYFISQLEEFDENVKEVLLLLSKDSLTQLAWRLASSRKLLRFDEALYCFDAALKKDPEDLNIFNLRGECYVLMHRPNEAITDFRKVLESAPRQGQRTLYKLIETLISARKFEEAIEETRILNKKGLVQLASYFLGKNKFESALFIYDMSIERYPTEATFYYLRGESYLQMKELVMADSDFATEKYQILEFQLSDVQLQWFLHKILRASDPEQQLHFVELILAAQREKKVDVRHQKELEDVLSNLTAVQLLELANRFFVNNQLAESKLVGIVAKEVYPDEAGLFETLRKQIFDKEVDETRVRLRKSKFKD